MQQVTSMKLSTMLLASALIAAPAAFAGSQALSEDSAYGICTAYENSEEGRENGNASQAPPFQALEENATAENESVESYCSDVDHPADEHPPEDPGATADQHRPDDAGSPEDDSEDAGDSEEDHGQADDRRPDHAGPP